MKDLIQRIAEKLASAWNGLWGWVQDAIINALGAAIEDAIKAGYNAISNYLAGFSYATLSKVAKLLGV
ncbi:hypothetical protein ABEO66_00290 [Bacillus pacificus]|uniref:hypothetical protein n=1 Tax=Bacillus TaxID=1386 RepID=UPI001FB23EF5|nr:hypothetical protein [Bacillus sp. ZJS3]UOB79049.1 hypothetical protein MQW34_27085 [Bacillus sp. ZJS3]